MKKRTVSLFLIVIFAVVISLLAVSVSAKDVAASGKCGDNLTWTLYADGEMIISGSGNMYNYQTWVNEPQSAFEDGYWKNLDIPWKNVQKLTVKSGVGSIGAGAFLHCGSLKAVTLESGVTVIEREAFKECVGLVEVALPQGLETIANSAFESCKKLDKISIPESVKSIGTLAFRDCPLTQVDLAGDPTVGHEAFTASFDNNSGKCGPNAFWKLEGNTLTVSGYGKMDNYDFGDRGGAQYSPGWSKYLQCSCWVNGYSTTYPCNPITKIVISEGITYIGSYAFSRSSGGFDHYQDIYVPATVKNIGVAAISFTCIKPFIVRIHYNGTEEDWNKLENVSGINVGSETNSVVVYPGVQGSSLWAKNSGWSTAELEKACELGIFPDILKYKDLTRSITRKEFAAIAVKTYEKLTGKTDIPVGVNPFTDTNNPEILKAYSAGFTTGVSATLFAPDALINREQAATMLARVYKKASIPGWTIETDGSHHLMYAVPEAFADDADISSWAKESVYFMAANGIVGGVGNNLFAPKNITAEHEVIGYANATREQAVIIAVRMVEKLPLPGLSSGKCGENLTWTLDSDGVLVVSGTGVMEDYDVDKAPWGFAKDKIKRIIIEDGVTTVGKFAFFNCENVTEVTLGNSVTTIRYDAFRACKSLAEIVFPASVAEIKEYAFVDCKSLANVTIPAGVKSVSSTAFKGCDALTAINVDANNLYYSSADGVLFNKDKTTLVCFPAASSITSYSIPVGVTKIDNCAFCGCKGLVGIVIPDTVEEIEPNAFAECTNIPSIIIPESVKFVINMAFAGWTPSQHIYIMGDTSCWAFHWRDDCEAQIHYENK